MQPPSNDTSSMCFNASGAPIDPTITTKSSLSKLGSSKNGRKTQEEFSLNDINQLLHTVIKVNPYLAPRNQIGVKWKEIEGEGQG
jgi:hypothetical protein